MCKQVKSLMFMPKLIHHGEMAGGERLLGGGGTNESRDSQIQMFL